MGHDRLTRSTDFAPAPGVTRVPHMRASVTHKALVWMALICALPLTAGCSAEEAPAAATSPWSSSDRKTQEPLALVCDAKTPVCWTTEVAKFPGLQAVADGVGKPLQAAGVITDVAGNSLLWAELAPDPKSPRTEVTAVFGRCNTKKVCTAGKAQYTATGATFTDAAGAPLKDVMIGRPVLRKKLKAHAPDKDPTLLAPLETAAKPDAEAAWAAFSQVQFQKRRFVILNAYGPEVGVDAAPIASAAVASGRFDSVETINYARSSDILAMIPALTGIDALVWIGAGVYEERAEGPRRHGMTVSRGVFGDELIYGKLVPNLIKGLPLGGPGLVLLAGADSIGQDGWNDLNTLASVLHDVPARAVVGLAGTSSAADVVAGSAHLVQSLMGGASLDVAVKAMGGPAIADVSGDAAKTWKWAESSAKFWGAASPSKAALKMFADLDSPYCTHSYASCDRASLTAGYGKDPVPSGEITAGHTTYSCQNLTVQGPYFSCDVDDPSAGQKFIIRGVMRGHATGDRFWVLALGTGITKYKDLLIIGEGVFDSVDQGGGSSSLKFKGAAVAGTWVDEDDRCCSIKGGAALNSHLGEASVLQIWP